MASVDINAIKDQIVAILQDDSTIYTTTGATSKSVLRKIEAGAPSGKGINEPPLPRCWVTSGSPVARIKKFAIAQSNALVGTSYEMMFDIIFAADGKGGAKVEEFLDDMGKKIIEKLQANYDLRDVGGAESTRLADKSEIVGIEKFTNLIGESIDARTIKFKVWSTA